MSRPAKYLFDRTFAPAHAARIETAADRQLNEEREQLLQSARRQGYEEGRLEGERAALATLEARSVAAVTAIAERAEALQQAMVEECDAIHRHAVQVALAVAERLATALVRSQPVAEIEALIGECLAHIGQAPRLELRVSPALAADVEARLHAAAKARGYAGQLAVIADSTIEPGDCRMEWADGGMARDMAATLSDIDAAVTRHLAARRHACRPLTMHQHKSGDA